MQINFYTNDQRTADALDLAFGADASIHFQSSNEVAGDCLVDFGNSYGSIDAAPLDIIGAQLQAKIRLGIIRYHFNEMPVGSCLLIETGKLAIPFFAYAPTGRIDEKNYYDSFFAILRQIKMFNAQYSEVGENKINSLAWVAGALPDAEKSALQLALAHKHFNTPLDLTKENDILARVQAIRGIL